MINSTGVSDGFPSERRNRSHRSPISPGSSTGEAHRRRPESGSRIVPRIQELDSANHSWPSDPTEDTVGEAAEWVPVHRRGPIRRAFPSDAVLRLSAKQPLLSHLLGTYTSRVTEELKTLALVYSLRAYEFFEPEEGKTPDVVFEVITSEMDFEERMALLESLANLFDVTVNEISATLQTPKERKSFREAADLVYVQVKL